MPSTYTLISSNVLTTATASVTFSAIPSTYTDLVLRVSLRGNASGNTAVNWVLKINNDTSTLYSMTRALGDGASASSDRVSSYPQMFVGQMNGSTSTANSFSSTEIYFPNYAGAANKVAFLDYATETNATTAYRGAIAELYRSTNAITSLVLDCPSDPNFASGSSFYLYGIKNS